MTEKKTITDERLAELTQQGDKQAQEQLLLRYQKLVRFCARKFFLVGGETEDLIQEGMMGLLQAMNTYKQDASATFKSFAYLCICRRIMDAVKLAAKKQPSGKLVFSSELDFIPSIPDPDAQMIYIDDQNELMQKIGGILSDLEFRVFTLYLGGMNCMEICSSTGKEYKSVDNALQRAKNKIQAWLKK